MDLAVIVSYLLTSQKQKQETLRQQVSSGGSMYNITPETLLPKREPVSGEVVTSTNL